MKRFCHKVAALGLAVTLVVLAVSAFERRVEMKSKQAVAYANMPAQLDIANTGSSHGSRSFDYATCPNLSGFSFAMGSQTLAYDHNLVDRHADHFRPGAVLLIPVSYFSLWEQELESDDFSSKNLRYRPLLPADHMLYRDTQDMIITEYLGALRTADLWMGTIVYPAWRKATEGFDLSREQAGEMRSAVHLALCYDEQGDLLPMNDDALEALHNLLALCQARDIRPILITTPVSEHYSRWYPPELLDAFYATMDGYVTQYRVDYWDFSQDEAFASHDELFRDTDHLNPDGAALFTHMVVERAGLGCP